LNFCRFAEGPIIAKICYITTISDEVGLWLLNPLTMNRIFTVLILLFLTRTSFAQDIQSAVATRKFHFENNSLVDSTSEQLTPLSYGSIGVYSGSMKYTTEFEGVFYQAFYGANKIFFRKSSDGIAWSAAVTVTDTTLVGYTEYHPNIAVWRSGTEIHVGIAYIDSSQPLEQLRFIKSTDGGNTFGAAVFLSNHTDSNSIMNCGFSSKGDTLLASWTRYDGWAWQYLWESHSLDGGITWSAEQIVYTGWQYTFVGDSDIDDTGNFYAVICADLGWRVELVLVQSTDLGQTWVQTTQPTDLGSPNTSTNAQLLAANGIVFISATHSLSYLDNVNLHRSEDSGQTWSAIAVSDSDSLHVSNIGNGTLQYCHTAIAKGGGDRLYMVWADSRDSNVPDWNLCNYYIYLAWSDDNGLTWSPNYRVSSPSNTAITTNVYCNVTVVPGETGDDVLVSWSKNRDVSLLQVPGCTDNTACNYAIEANTDDGSCLHVGDACDDGNTSTLNDVITEMCECAGIVSGVEEWKSKFAIYPNPANDFVQLSAFSNATIQHLEIRDALGRIALIQSVYQPSVRLNIQSLSAGRYAIVLQTSEKVYIIPLVVTED
jgi:hypothetical protein